MSLNGAASVEYWRAIHYYVRTCAKISGVRKFCDFSYVLFTIDSYEFSYVRAAHDDRIMGVHGHLWACLFISDQKRLVC